MRRLMILAATATALNAGCGSKDKPAATPAPEAAAPAAPAAETPVAETPVAETPVAADDVTTPAEEPKAPALAPEVKAAAESALSGCIGFTEDGDKALVFFVYKKSEANVTRATVWMSTKVADDGAIFFEHEAACGDDDAPACVDGLPPRTAEETGILTKAIADKALVPCVAVNSDASGDAVVRPLGKEVTISVDNNGLGFSRDEGPTSRLVAFDQVDEVAGRTFTAYASPATSSVFIGLRTETSPGEFTTETHFIRGSELGIAPCIAPGEGKPAAAGELGPVPDKATEVGCFAMTGDGKAALMAVKSEDTMPAMDGEARDEEDARDSALSLVWVGVDHGGTLDCLLDSTTCAGEDTPARKAFIEKLGLTACPAPTNDLWAGGGTFPLVATGNRLWFDHPTAGRRWLMTFAMDAHDGGRHESYEAAWQHPRGGPLFVLYNNEDTGLKESLAGIVAEKTFGFCAAE